MDKVGGEEAQSRSPNLSRAVRTLGPAKPGSPSTPASVWEEGSHSGPRARGAGAKESQEIVGHRLLGGDATCFLGCSFKDDEIFLEMLIQFQDGCHIPTAGFGKQHR